MTDGPRHPANNLRRQDDDRFTKLEGKIDETKEKVDAIHILLMTEPEASPLGRSLLKYALENRRLIEDLRTDFVRHKRDDFGPLEDWWQQWRGIWRFVIGIGIVLGVIGSFFGIVAFFGPHP